MTEATAILRHGDPEHFEAVAEHVPTMLFRTDGRGELTFAFFYGTQLRAPLR